MTPDVWGRLKPLFDQAVDLGPQERKKFLDQVCRDDEGIGQKLASLIEAHEKTAPPTQPILDFHAILPGRPQSFAPGEVILDRFHIIRLIGCGGMGEVYEAGDIHLGRVALKTIRPELAHDESILARFLRSDVKLAIEVTNIHVCRIHNLFTAPGRGGSSQVHFLTMEYLDGVTLADRLQRDGPLPLADIQAIALDLCDGLRAIHNRKIVHRDLKPGNIMLVPGRCEGSQISAVIMDLGIARELASDGITETGLTRIGAFVGTLDYSSPEQLRGTAVGPPADLYALGIILYEVITGKRPFHGKTPQDALTQRTQPLTPGSTIRTGLPRLWDALIAKCLAFDPEKRFPSAAAVAAALTEKPVSRPRQRLALFAFATVALFTGLAFWYNSRPAPAPSPDAQRWYETGLAALRADTFYKATQALTRAVDLDPNFVVAHARLADAWAELDFVGKAKDEMLKASGIQSRRRISATDARYVDAVRASLIYDYAASVEDYRAILKQLPAADKAYGYVDLGRAYEKAGDVTNALKSYAEASRLAPEYPASFVHLGILDSRRGDDAAGDAAFSRAESLYHAASDVEGAAEVEYARGYAASLKGDTPHAREYLGKSLRAAQDIPSAQLEIRNIIRLSTVEYLADNPDKSIQLANQAIQLAREKGLDYWAIDGLVRMSNAWLTKGDYANAEPPLQEALTLAKESQRPRLEAGARLTLASIRSAQSKPDESIELAQAALDYYGPAGFNVESTSALILIVRAEVGKGDFKTALPRAMQALDLGKKSGNLSSMVQLEELAGSVLLGIENYPEALVHFEAALDAARRINQFVEYETEDCAEVLWRLGRYDEAKSMIASIPSDVAKRRPVAIGIENLNGYIKLSRLESQAAFDIARRSLADPSDMSIDTVIDFEILAGEAAVEARQVGQSVAFCGKALDQAIEQKNSRFTARAGLCLAEADLIAGSYQKALPLAQSAYRFFTASGQTESQWRGLLALARIYEFSGNKPEAKKISHEALDILGTDEHNWGNPAAEIYARRPDIQAWRTELVRLSRD